MTNRSRHKISVNAQESEPCTSLPGFRNINRYWDKMNNCYAAKLLPGDYYITNQEEVIVTTLGSCISACIRDIRLGIGGMNHFMLPNKPLYADSWSNTSSSTANRYGASAMENLINDILRNGGERRNLEVKIFGGGKILAQLTDIGKNNIDFVRRYIQTEKLSLVAEDVGDIFPRKVIYNPLTGKAKVLKLRSLHNQTIIERETKYLHDIESSPISGDIELF